MRSRFALRLLGLTALALLVGLPTGTGWGRTPTRPSLATDSFASGFDRPVAITHAGDGLGRLFVVDQPGVIHIVNNDGVVDPTPFLDIQARVRDTGSEEGLLGLAFPPHFEDKGHFYVYYTELDGDNRVARFHMSGDPD